MDTFVALWLPDSAIDDTEVVGVFLDLEEAQKACQQNQDGFLDREERILLAWETLPRERGRVTYFHNLAPGSIAEAGVGGNYVVAECTVRRYA